MANSQQATRSAAAARKQGLRGAVCTMLGIVASGPLSWLALGVIAPQPEWDGAAAFAEHFHPLQSLPFFAGFLLIAGYVSLISSLHALARPRHKPATYVALVFTAAYTALIVFNYTVQTTFVPAHATRFVPENALALGMWSMANPLSLAWGIELWGYACLGIATWFVAPVLAERGSRGRWAALAFRWNGIVSIATALWAALSPGWVMTRSGLAAYVLWNLLAFAMSWLAFDALHRKHQTQTPRTQSMSESAA